MNYEAPSEEEVMKFEEALSRFKKEIALEYGFSEGLVKIAITPDLFAAFMNDKLKTEMQYGIAHTHIGFGQLGELFIEDVQVLQRTRDSF